MTIVTNRQYEKEEEDFRAKKKKVPFGGADAFVKERIAEREAAERAEGRSFGSGMSKVDERRLHEQHSSHGRAEATRQRDFEGQQKENDRLLKMHTELKEQDEQKTQTPEQQQKQSEAQEIAEKARAEMESQSQEHHQGRSM